MPRPSFSPVCRMSSFVFGFCFFSLVLFVLTARLQRTVFAHMTLGWEVLIERPVRGVMFTGEFPGALLVLCPLPNQQTQGTCCLPVGKYWRFYAYQCQPARTSRSQSIVNRKLFNWSPTWCSFGVCSMWPRAPHAFPMGQPLS